MALLRSFIMLSSICFFEGARAADRRNVVVVEGSEVWLPCGDMTNNDGCSEVEWDQTLEGATIPKKRLFRGLKRQSEADNSFDIANLNCSLHIRKAAKEHGTQYICHSPSSGYVPSYVTVIAAGYPQLSSNASTAVPDEKVALKCIVSYYSHSSLKASLTLLFNGTKLSEQTFTSSPASINSTFEITQNLYDQTKNGFTPTFGCQIVVSQNESMQSRVERSNEILLTEVIFQKSESKTVWIGVIVAVAVVILIIIIVVILIWLKKSKQQAASVPEQVHLKDTSTYPTSGNAYSNKPASAGRDTTTAHTPDVVQVQGESLIYADFTDTRHKNVPQKPQRGELRESENIYSDVAVA